MDFINTNNYTEAKYDLALNCENQINKITMSHPFAVMVGHSSQGSLLIDLMCLL